MWGYNRTFGKIKLFCEDSTMECIPKCTEMLRVNQPIRVQPEVKEKEGLGRERGGVSTVQHCQTEMEITVQHVQETCPIRCIRDCISSTAGVSWKAKSCSSSRRLQVGSMMRDKGVAQSVIVFI